METDFERLLDETRADVADLKREIKYILQILDKVTEAIERNNTLHAQVIKLGEKLEYINTRLSVVEKKVGKLQTELLSQCPTHVSRLNHMMDRIEDLESDIARLEDDTKEDFRFRDKVLISLAVSIILQIIGLIFYTLFKR